MKVHLNTLNLKDRCFGTIEITINGETQTVNCWSKDSREQGRGWWIDIYGIACKFRNGNKIWPAEITYSVESDKFFDLKPRNYTRYNKGIYCSLIGFESDFQDSQVRSQHNGGYRN